MKVQNLQTATKLLAEIHEIDTQIIQLEKKAILIADGNNFSGISLSFEEPPKEQSSLDTDGYEYGFKSMYSFLYPASMGTAAKANTEKLSFALSEHECLFVMGALIQAKKDHRKILVDKIYSLGVTI